LYYSINGVTFFPYKHLGQVKVGTLLNIMAEFGVGGAVGNAFNLCDQGFIYACIEHVGCNTNDRRFNLTLGIQW
jgi:hypothetical protein